jgi:biotin operon repressor
VPMTPTEVADALGKSANTVKTQMWRMAQNGQLTNNRDGGYAVSNRNPCNPVTEEQAGYRVTGVTEADSP